MNIRQHTHTHTRKVLYEKVADAWWWTSVLTAHRTMADWHAQLATTITITARERPHSRNPHMMLPSRAQHAPAAPKQRGSAQPGRTSAIINCFTACWTMFVFFIRVPAFGVFVRRGSLHQHRCVSFSFLSRAWPCFSWVGLLLLIGRHSLPGRPHPYKVQPLYISFLLYDPPDERTSDNGILFTKQAYSIVIKQYVLLSQSLILVCPT